MNRIGLVTLVGVLWAVSASAAEPNEKGGKLWKAKCAQCHGTDGKAVTKQGAKMGISDITKPEWQKEFTDQKIKDTLSSGLKRERNGKKQEMDPWGKELEPAEFDALVQYVRSLAAAAAPATPAPKK